MIKSLITQNALRPNTASHSSLSLCLINTENSGKRIKLSKGILSKLGNPSAIGFAPNSETGNLLLYADPEHGYHLCKGCTIYAASLVNELTKLFGLDFTNKTSQTFVNITMKHDDEDNIDYADIILKEGGTAHDNS